jgi:hypothetical protein
MYVDAPFFIWPSLGEVYSWTGEFLHHSLVLQGCMGQKADVWCSDKPKANITGQTMP